MVLMLDHISSPDSLSRFRLVVRKHPGVCLLHLDTLFFLLTAAQFIYLLLDLRRFWFLLVQAAAPLLVTADPPGPSGPHQRVAVGLLEGERGLFIFQMPP